LEQEAYLEAFAPGLKRKDLRLKVRRGVETTSDSSGIAQVITSSRIGEMQLIGEFSMFICLKKNLSQYFNLELVSTREGSPLIFIFPN